MLPNLPTPCCGRASPVTDMQSDSGKGGAPFLAQGKSQQGPLLPRAGGLQESPFLWTGQALPQQ